MKDKPIDWREVFGFLVMGCVSTGIDFIIYIILSKKIDYNVSKIVSMTIACLVSFIVNRRWTFSYEGKTSVAVIIKFIVSQIANITANAVTNHIIYNITKERVLSFLAATMAGMTVNFLLQKYFVFTLKERRK